MAKQKLSVQEAQKLLEQAKVPGFRKANKKLLREAEEVVKNDRKDRANAFLEEYKEVCKKHGIEIKAQIEPAQIPGLVKAGLYLDEYVEKKPPQTKKWSEAMGENLDNRKKCQHKEHDEGNICEKCGLALQNWHESGTGVVQEYEDRIIAKIKDQQEKEEQEAKEEDTATKAATGADK